MKTLRYAPLLLCLCIGQALADTPIQLEHAATPTARVSISNVAGEVRVTAWDRPAVQVSGSLGDGSAPLAITGSNGELAIKVRARDSDGGWFDWGNNRHMAPTTLDVRVPRGATLDVRVVSAPLAVDGLDGGRITVNSVSGRVRINARTPELDVESVSGNIELAGQAGEAELQTVSGDILAPVLGRKAELETISGRIQAGGGPWQSFKASSVSGNVQAAGSLASNGTLRIDSMSGDVQLQLPATSSASLHAESFSGDLRSDFGDVQRAEHGPGSSLDTRLGSGSGSIKLETFSGNLRIRSAD